MTTVRRSLGLFALACGLSAPASAWDDDHSKHQHARPEKLGTITFPISCAPATHAPFARAVALLHSFWYDEAEKAFNAVAATDPKCAMAHWGVAMSLYHPIWAAPTPIERQRGRAAVAKARAAAAPTEREKGYVAAIGTYFDDSEKVEHPKRAAAYAQAMGELAKAYPDDREASIFHALALLGTASPQDKTYAVSRQAGEILNRVLPLQPDHPGVAHYLIHSFDYPQLADLALPAARSYSKIAESSPHALHMPSHIFVRLGLWDDAIRSNEESAEAARAHVAKTKPGASAFDELHALDYLAYAFLQQGREQKAREVLDKIRKVSTLDNANFAAAYALAAVPARFALERGRWDEAAALEIAPFSFPWSEFPFAEAIVQYARAIGAARSGDVERARKAVARLEALRAAATEAKLTYWAGQINLQHRAATAWVAEAEGRKDEALTLMKEAVDLEAATDKHPVTPGPVLPVREMYGDLLLARGRAKEALAEYEASLLSAPNRLGALNAAVRAAMAAQQEDKVQALRATLAKVAAKADATPPKKP